MNVRDVLDEIRKEVADMEGQLDPDMAIKKTVGRVMARIDSIQIMLFKQALPIPGRP